MTIAKIAWTGGSQVVVVPKEIRIDSDRVRIRRRGSSIILEPCEPDWNWLRTRADPIDEDFETAALNQLPAQDSKVPDDL